MKVAEISWPAVRAFTKVWNPIAERLDTHMYDLTILRVARRLNMRSEILHEMFQEAYYAHYERYRLSRARNSALKSSRTHSNPEDDKS